MTTRRPRPGGARPAGVPVGLFDLHLRQRLLDGPAADFPEVQIW
ncbi:hypothetical protein [Symbioplanes lichenis]|nr:hypothetical protein [Actinoplanes lichenis]